MTFVPGRRPDDRPQARTTDTTRGVPVRILFTLAGPAVAIGAVLVIAAVQLDLGIGPAYLLGVLLIVLGVAGQLLKVRRQRPREDRSEERRVGKEGGGRWWADARTTSKGEQ